jgi:hypothetical protein
MSEHRKHLHPPSPTEAESFGAPWMKWALEELGKKVAEHDSASEYKTTLYHTLSVRVASVLGCCPVKPMRLTRFRYI